MNKYLLGAGLGVLALIGLGVVHAKAQTVPPGFCPNVTEFKDLSKALGEKFHEVPAQAGIAREDGKAAMMLFEAPQGETWTLLIVTADGKACIVGAGNKWTEIGVPADKPQSKFDPNNREADNG